MNARLNARGRVETHEGNYGKCSGNSASTRRGPGRGIEYSVAHRKGKCQHGVHGLEEDKTLNGGAHKELAGNVGWNPLQYYRGNHLAECI